MLTNGKLVTCVLVLNGKLHQCLPAAVLRETTHDILTV